MNVKVQLAGLVLWICFHATALSQTSVTELMNEQDQLDSQRSQPVEATFETTRLINEHSVESTKKGCLDFRISHRFTRIDEGFYDWFGMDNANIRLGLDYGITDRWMAGVGRSSLDKEYDIDTKYKILQQTTGHKSMPISLSALGEGMIRTMKNFDSTTDPLEDRLSTAVQLMVARKFSDRISLQLMPTWIYYSKTPIDGDPNNIYSIGVGGSVKIINRIRLNAEYYPLFSGNKLTGTTAPFTVGFDIQTGGHVFQLFVSNTMGTNERLTITQTYDQWSKGQLHIGFNIMRTFTIVKQKK